MSRWYLVRHAQTPWNQANRIQGRSDLPLSPIGAAQAKRLQQYFAARPVGTIVTSHLQRSRQTADAIAAGNGPRVPPRIEPDVAEMHLGAWEGLTPEEIDARFHGAYQQWRHRPSTVRIPEAESLEAFRVRVRQAMERLTAGVEGGAHVLVSHGGVIAAILTEVLGADYDRLLRRLRLDNAGVTAVEWTGESAHILWVNATAHLEDGAPDRSLLASGNWF